MCSPEVEEDEDDGSLVNVAKAVRRGASMLCFACDKKGATVGCMIGRCRSVFHVPCARTVGPRGSGGVRGWSGGGGSGGGDGFSVL